MSLKFNKGTYNIKNPEKYVGTKIPTWRSSWELTFMMFCDNNPSIQQWASEAVKIPYRDPLTGKQSVYLPDFFIVYLDKNMKKHAELIEVKPAKQAFKESVGKNAYDQAQFVKNQAKWSAATAWCKQNGLRFRIVTESDIYVNMSSKNK